MQSENVVRLRNKELFSIKENCTGMIISCRTGVLWLTREGDPADHLIRAGEKLTIGDEGLILISALADSAFEIGRDPV
jgi:hypothetical protein